MYIVCVWDDYRRRIDWSHLSDRNHGDNTCHVLIETFVLLQNQLAILLSFIYTVNSLYRSHTEYLNHSVFCVYFVITLEWKFTAHERLILYVWLMCFSYSHVLMCFNRSSSWICLSCLAARWFWMGRFMRAVGWWAARVRLWEAWSVLIPVWTRGRCSRICPVLSSDTAVWL